MDGHGEVGRAEHGSACSNQVERGRLVVDDGVRKPATRTGQERGCERRGSVVHPSRRLLRARVRSLDDPATQLAEYQHALWQAEQPLSLKTRAPTCRSVSSVPAPSRAQASKSARVWMV